MDPREMETLVQRLVQNPHDQDTITYAHQAGQSDPKSYAMLLEKVGTATRDPAFACHWLTEAANVWSTTLGDAHRAARALMIAIDRDPTQATPAERLAELYRDKGDTKALVALLERRARALGPLTQSDPTLRAQVSAIHEELGQLWQSPPLTQPKKAMENYRRAVEYDATSQYSVYALRELYKAAAQWVEAIPYFAMEQQLVEDPERKVALYQDEGDVRKNAHDLAGAAVAFRRAREIEGAQDPTLKQQLGTAILELAQSGQRVAVGELNEGADLFVELAEEYPGEHGLAYSLCALELVPAHDRAVQLAMYYGEQLNRAAEVAPRAAAYLKANPHGTLAAEARKLVTDTMDAGGDESLLEALAPPPGAGDTERVHALIDVAQALTRKAKKAEASLKFREVLEIERANVEAIAFLEPFLRQSRKFADLHQILLAASQDENADVEQRQSWLREVAGLCETQLRDLDGAIAALKELLVLDADDDPARAALKRLLEKQSRWDDLAVLLASEADQTLDIEARISLEKALAKLHEQKRKDPIATGEAWGRIAALASGDEEAITTAVRYFESGQRLDLAIQVIAENLQAVDDAAQRAALLQKLAELRDTTGDALHAGEAFAESASLFQSSATWASAERCFVTAEAWEQAASAADERAQLTESTVDKAALFATEAGYLSRAGDDSSSVLRLEQATELDPENDTYAKELEQRYMSAERNEDLAGFLLRRADRLPSQGLRSDLRKRAAALQRDALGNPEAARLTLQEVLRDGEDREALTTLADDAEERGEFAEAVAFLARLDQASTDPAAHTAVLLRQAGLLSSGAEGLTGAIALYERVLKEFEPKHDASLAAIAALHERLDQPKGVADALERRLLILEDSAEKLKVAEQLAALYEQALDEPKLAVRALDCMRALDPKNLDVVLRLSELCAKLEDWPRVAQHLSELIEVEADGAEVSRMTRHLAEILHEKLKNNDDALAALMHVADAGDEACREEYVRLGDALGWKGIVATKLVEWYAEAAAGSARGAHLRGAFERFIDVGRDADAASVAKELARTHGADAEIARELERIAVKLKDLDALGIAHDLLVQDLSGPARAEEMVRQAEVLAGVGVAASEAINHGEQALTSVSPAEVEPLLARLAKLTDAAPRILEIYERQITRCKAPSDKLSALARAASMAGSLGLYQKARAFFDIALGGAVHDDTLNSLSAMARTSDAEQKTDKLRRTLAEALANGGQGSRDGGRTRGLLLGRAADIAYRELKDIEQAFTWLGDAIVTHVDDEPLAALERLAEELDQPLRVETVLSRALDEVFDGPLVRKLLARRAFVRREKLTDPQGAAADLKRLHDLSPADTAVMDQLARLYTELEDFRGMVQLYEDQILRGKDPNARAELARKVARLWEDKLSDPREAADAWRRVLRLKAQDPEATEGLDRAKANMLKRAVSEPPPEQPSPALSSLGGKTLDRSGKPNAAKGKGSSAAGDKVVDEKPADEKPADEKPADEKPADEKPADEKPADEKPADEKPADEKPADERPADEKLADEKFADEKFADEKLTDEIGKSEQASPAREQSPANETAALETAPPQAARASNPIPAQPPPIHVDADPPPSLRRSATPPPLPGGASSPTNGIAPNHPETGPAPAGLANRSPSSPGRKGPPPKPSAKKPGGPPVPPSIPQRSAPPPPPPSRVSATPSASAPLKAPPPTRSRPAQQPPAPLASPAVPASGSEKSSPLAANRPNDAATRSSAIEPIPDDFDDDDALTVDEDELIDDGR